MTNSDVLTYLNQFEKFSTARIQRHFKWGYNRTINKIIEFVDSGLIYEIPNEPLTFRISDKGQNPPIESFATTLRNRELKIPAIRPHHKVRIWFESVKSDISQPVYTKDLINLINKLASYNTSEKTHIINASKNIKFQLKHNIHNETRNILFSYRYLVKLPSPTLIILINSLRDISIMKRILKKAAFNNHQVEKLYIVGNDVLLKQFRKIVMQ